MKIPFRFPFIKPSPYEKRLSPRKISRRTLSLALLAILAVSGIFYLWKLNRHPKVEKEFLPDIEVVTVKREDVVRSIKSPGTVTYLEKASVSSRIPGRLESFQAEQGTEVRKGQVLAQLERLEMELQLRQTRASLKSAEAQHDLSRAQYGQARREVERRMKQIESSQAGIVEARAQFANSRQNLLMKMDLYRMGGISRKELRSLYSEYLAGLSRYYQSRKGNQTQMVGFRDEDLDQAGVSVPREPKEKIKAFVDFNTNVEKNSVGVAMENVNKVRVEISNTERLLAETTLRSPINGVVATRTIEIGEEVKAGEPLFTIVRMDELLVSTNVSENDLKHVRRGQSVRFNVDAFNGEEFRGTVRLISPVIDMNTRTTEVRIDVKNPDRRLAPGMFVRCFIETDSRQNAILLPEEAFAEINEKENTAIVFVIQENHAFRRPVQLGDLFEKGREVLSGLRDGERIAVSNVSLLKEGARIRAGESKQEKEKRP